MFRLLLLLLLALAPSARAQTHQAHPAPRPAAKPETPKEIGKFDDWVAATYVEAGQLVCYAFTRPTASTPAISGRGDVVLTVTERSTGRDTVALRAGFAFGPRDAVILDIDQTKIELYTAQRSAFSRDGQATVLALEKGRQAITRSPGPHNATVTDTFSLRGFSAAYAAITKACPAR